MSAKEKRIVQAFKKDGGDFKMNSTTGKQFAREHEKGEKKEELLKAAATPESKEAFRKKWLAAQYSAVIKKKRFTKSWCRIDTEKGRCMSLLTIAQEYGGAEYGSARRAAERYCTKCIRMAGPWVRFNGMTDRVDFLYLKIGYQEDSRNSTTSTASGRTQPR